MHVIQVVGYEQSRIAILRNCSDKLQDFPNLLYGQSCIRFFENCQLRIKVDSTANCQPLPLTSRQGANQSICRDANPAETNTLL